MRRWIALPIALVACGDPSGASAPADAAPVADAGPSVDGDAATMVGDGGASGSRCTIAADTITCLKQTTTVGGRTVAYALPLGDAPATGWPAVLYFQGSFVAGDTAFAASRSDTFGRFELTRTIKALLDRGYAVVAPDAAGGGFWETNIAPYAINWSGCDDDRLMQALFASIAKGDLGPLDSARLYAMGISSGGFMTSRMAVSYRGKFRALADSAGSYATCGAVCSVPTPLPADHPPILFLHGDADTVVPMTIVQPYLHALKAEGHETKLVTDADAGHEWLRAGPDAVPSWFDSHP